MAGTSGSNNCGSLGSATDSSVERQLHEFDNLVSEGAIVISDSSSDNYDDIVDLISDTEEVALAEVKQGGLEFPDGAVRLTNILNEPRDTSKYYSLTDLVQPNRLRKALLTTFVMDIDWLLSHFDPSTKLVIVKSYRPKEEDPGVYQSEGGRLTFINPTFGAQKFPVMHSKIMLLFYDNYVRFATLSANLVEIDWTVLANIMFIQDFPYTPDSIPAGMTNRNDQCSLQFGETLKAALLDLDVPEQVVSQLKHMDMSRARVHIVTTVPSPRFRLKSKRADSYGVSRLGNVIETLRGSTPLSEWFDTKLFCYGSSLSRLDSKYLAWFYKCVLGKAVHYPRYLCEEVGYASEEEYESRILSQNIAVGFHTQDQTNENKFGAIPKQCIMLSPDVFFSKDYPSSALHKVNPKVPRVLIHAKVIFARHGGSKGWMYLGSHNFTRGAWGTFAGNFGKASYYNNYEFGVVLPGVRYEEVSGGKTAVVWNGIEIPVPFEPYPWTRYSEMDMPNMDGM
ncbi:hypothetical protein IW140_005021 [Coemansia sp. RSA 1813]|nr:hypothetical protein EV178_004003 [Coemansia sp. RSA 1646]KAJ1768823.1 hypothetical protein LPJ74_004567 [Coemansia sp. RSA 1843]KAJ2087223.1 hypothetical protein IW138_005138 [Coemansia sp. RSA 986]KAJ2210946.1 hypothetical protein EV179_005872 [Coemansia sp. RSA 487]KAJ2566208.1 hypothetical protein IW140_005021 [Coemansia sp. RSA 1813]